MKKVNEKVMRKTFLMLAIILIFIGCGNGNGVEEKIPIPEKFMPSYKIVTAERIDYEWDGLDIFRKSYRIVLPEKMTFEEIKNNCRYLTVKTYNEGVSNVSIFVYRDVNETNGSYTVAMYEFCPFGDWNRTNEMYEARLDNYEENFVLK